MSKMIQVLAFGAVVAFGVFMFVFGGYDDSPGAQLLGAVAVGAGIWGIVKSTKRSS